MSTGSRRLCLAGHGIRGSPSPAMHAAALAARGIAGAYELRDLRAAELPAFIGELREGRYAGCNVTIPYKTTLAATCDVLEGDAHLLGAVNTIRVDGGRLIGFNTDVLGFRRAMNLQGAPEMPAAAVVMGAGGAAAAVTLALLQSGCTGVDLVARHEAAASALAQRLRPLGEVRPQVWRSDALVEVLRSAGVVVNATPAGLAGMPFSVQDLPASCTVADVRYRPRPLDLVAAARAAGLAAWDGSEMLLQQAMLSFELWCGAPAPAAAMRAALYADLAG